MYDVPTNPKIEKCIITKETVEKKTPPELVINENKKARSIKIKKKQVIPKKQGETA